ncbi:MAG: SGNH/GDSL hydrolase family protein [Anaerolineae bacterium]|nr:SGNH/GDSL hydrolase family protein [Anaerolineae bacterium]
MSDKARLFWFRVFLSFSAIWIIHCLYAYQSSINQTVLGRYSLRYFVLITAASLALIGGVVFACGKRAAGFVAGDNQKTKAILIASWLPAGIIVYVVIFMLGQSSIRQMWNQLYGTAFAAATLAAIFATLDALRVIVKKPEFWMVVVSVIVSLLLVELGLRYMIHNFSREYDRLTLYDPTPIDRFTLRYEPHNYEGYIPARGWTSNEFDDMNNSLGFRGPEVKIPKPDGVYRIVAVGGSTTYGTEVNNWYESYPAQLEEVLREDYGYTNVEVINGGAAGYNSWETLINLAFRAMDVEPDLVIFYQNTNDVHSRIVPPDLYRGDNSARRTVWDQEMVDQMFNAWYIRIPSALWRFLGVNFEWFESPRGFGLGKVTSLPCSGNSADESCLGMTPEAALAANPPIYYERNIRSIVGISENNGADILLLTWASNPDKPGYSEREEYRVAYAEHNEIVERVARELDTHFYDFASAMSMDPVLWADGRHLTAEGNRVKAELIAAYIDEAGIIPAP